jgi:hypothetical protein
MGYTSVTTPPGASRTFRRTVDTRKDALGKALGAPSFWMRRASSVSDLSSFADSSS